MNIRTSRDLGKPVVAVIGLGNISKRHRKNIRLLYPGAAIVAVSASGREPLEAVENADLVAVSLAEAIALQPAFAIVASPASAHAGHACALMQAGIPALIEKPIAASVADSLVILNTQKQTRTPAAVAYCLRYLPSAQIVKQALCNQQLGAIYTVHINIGQYLPDWRPGSDYRESVSAQRKLGGGVLLELSHELDYLQWLFGNQNVQYACLRNSQELALEVDEIADLVLSNDKGTLSLLHLDFLQKSPCRRCIIIGSEARLEWDLIRNSVALHDRQGERLLYSDSAWDKNLMYMNMITDFVALSQGEGNQCIRLVEAFQTVSLIEQIRTKATQGTVQ